MDKYFSLLGNKVVIDCGHIIISGYDGDYSFGHDDKCSDGELMTFQEAVNVAKKLKSLDKNVLINIYLSDLSGFQGGNIGRKNLYDRVNNGDKYSFMPKEYIDLLCNTGLSESDIKINLQSMGNAKFKKKVKKTISFLEMNKKKTVHNYQEKIFSEYNSIFLTNSSHELFSLTTPWLFFYKEENAHLDGQWWLDDNIEIRDSWLKKLPLLKLKRKPFINLYESGGKVLCPATYGGLLSIYDNSFDHIAIYSRKDDKHVGEKVIKGVVATNILDDNFSRNCLQIIYSEFDEPEISFIGKNSIKEMKVDFNDFYKKVNEKKESQGLVFL